jgi:predicted transcriptional regulator
MDQKHEDLQDDLEEEIYEDSTEELDEDSMEEGHDPQNAPHQSVKSVEAASGKTKRQPLRRGDKQNSYPMHKVGTKAKEAIMAKEGIEGVFGEDLTALVESEATLSEGFKEKAEIIFEAALTSKLNEHVERLEDQYQMQLEEEVETFQGQLVEKVNTYLDYVVATWAEENRLAIENGLRTEIAESFMNSLHSVFTEHYIQVPEEKVDLVDGLADKVEELEESLNRVVQQNIELTESVKDYERNLVIAEATKDLSESQAEKLKSLSEDVAFETLEKFEDKVSTIKESYFKKSKVRVRSGEDQLIDESADVVELSPMMERYLNALKK